MTRTIGSNGEATLKALRAAGLKRLFDQGFAGMTLRELAGDVGIQAGSLYNYFANKQDFLYQLLKHVMGDLIDEMESKVAEAENPTSALLAYVDCHVFFHSSRRKEILLSGSELRSLTPENYHKIVSMRDGYESRLREILEWGHRENCWIVIDPKIATKMILGMMSSVGTWYKPDGHYQIPDLVKIYQDMILNILSNEAGADALTPIKVASSERS